MRTVAWLNKKYKTLHMATGEPFADEVRAEVMPLCDQGAAEAVIYARGAAMKELLVALRELVELEDMRLRLRQLHEVGHGTDYENYHKRLPLAWAAARAALGPTSADKRKPCTCDGAGRGPGRACVVKDGGRLGELWRCADGIGA